MEHNPSSRPVAQHDRKRWLGHLLGAVLVTIASTAMTRSGFAQDWVQPERTQANLDALARVQVKTYRFDETGVDMRYGLYVPTSYVSSKAMPLLIALHGRGSGIEYMMEYNNLVELAERYGYIVATPMGYNQFGWYGARGPGNDFNRQRDDPGPANLGSLSEQDVLNVLRFVRRDYNIDDHRIYLIGQSMGGGGTWYLGTKYPGIWAALGAMAPAVTSFEGERFLSPEILDGAKHIPVIVVQGDADEAVDVAGTREWVAKLKEIGAKYEYIEVPGGTHASAGRLNIDKVFAFLDRQQKP